MSIATTFVDKASQRGRMWSGEALFGSSVNARMCVVARISEVGT